MHIHCCNEHAAKKAGPWNEAFLLYETPSQEPGNGQFRFTMPITYSTKMRCRLMMLTSALISAERAGSVLSICAIFCSNRHANIDCAEFFFAVALCVHACKPMPITSAQ